MKQADLHSLLDRWENLAMLTDFLTDSPEQLDQLIQIGLNAPNKGSWRAIWVADKIHEKRPELIRPYIPQMIEALKSNTNESKLRHYLKLISLYPIPTAELSFLLDFSLGVFTDASRPVAIRVHAMQILYEISEQEPAFKPELIQLIEHEMEAHQSPGIASRGKRLLRKLSQAI